MSAATRAVAPAFVEHAAHLDRVLRPGERCDPGLLHRHEDAAELMVLQLFDPRDDLRVPDREAETPARHPVGLRHREELEADLARAVDRQEAGRLPVVEDEVAVREVVHHPTHPRGEPSRSPPRTHPRAHMRRAGSTDS